MGDRHLSSPRLSILKNRLTSLFELTTYRGFPDIYVEGLILRIVFQDGDSQTLSLKIVSQLKRRHDRVVRPG